MSGKNSIHCASLADLAGIFSKVEVDPFYILVEGAKSNETGLSWCGDCVRAEKIFEQVLSERAEPITVIELAAERAEYRTGVFKADQILKLQCVPTFIKFKRGKEIARLNDSQCQDADLVREILDL